MKRIKSRDANQPLFSHPQSLRVYGPAGAGKTRAGTELLAGHVEDGDFALADGIICSFTRTAAQDIARRVRDGGEPSRYHCTLHALVKRYYGFDSGIADTRLDEFFKAEKIPYKRTRGGDGEEWATSEGDDSSEGGKLVAFWSLCRNLLLPITAGMEEFAPRPGIEKWWSGDSMSRLWERYVDWKSSEKLIDFNDMLEMALDQPPEGAQWAYFLMDECQDSTPLQWAVANLFARQCDVAYLLGDDDQAVYGWAGGRPEDFLGARVQHEDTLHVNHRCRAAILTEAQSFIRRNERRHDKEMVAAHQGGTITRERDLPNLGTEQSTFIMARAHYLTVPLMAELESRGYPFIDRRGSMGVSGKAATQLARYRRLSQGDRISIDEWRLLLEAIPAKGPWLLYGAKKRIKELDVRFRQTNWMRAADVLDYGGTDALLTAIKAGVFDPLGYIPGERRDYLSEIERKYGSEFLDESWVAAVCQVGPIHAFKGLECDHVILHSGMPPAATREAWIDPEPERRVFYVAMTRARQRLTHLAGEAFAQWEQVL